MIKFIFLTFLILIFHLLFFSFLLYYCLYFLHFRSVSANFNLSFSIFFYFFIHFSFHQAPSDFLFVEIFWFSDACSTISDTWCNQVLLTVDHSPWNCFYPPPVYYKGLRPQAFDPKATENWMTSVDYAKCNAIIYIVVNYIKFIRRHSRCISSLCRTLYNPMYFEPCTLAHELHSTLNSA
jgi:hypothetical protein